MRRIVDVLSHYLHGSLAGFITGHFRWFGLAVSVFLFVQFISYEISEEMKIMDELYLELKEWSMGFALALTITLLLELHPTL